MPFGICPIMYFSDGMAKGISLSRTFMILGNINPGNSPTVLDRHVQCDWKTGLIKPGRQLFRMTIKRHVCLDFAGDLRYRPSHYPWKKRPYIK